MALRIGIVGATGQVGRLVAEEAAAQQLELVGGTVRAGSVKPVPAGLTPHDDLAALAGKADVLVEFTHGAAAATHAAILADGNAAWVLGTSGIPADGWKAVEAAALRIPVLFAANFAPGMTAVLALAELLGAALPGETYDAEIVDLYHRRKADAPSGTAIAIGESVARGRGIPLEGNKESGRDGDTGARKIGAIGFSALRGGQVVGDNTLIMTSASEQTILTHRVVDRRVYAKGAIRAAKWLAGRPPGLYSMTDVLA